MWGTNTWTDNTANGGYGTFSGGNSDTNMIFKTSVTASGFLHIAYGTVNGEEYFTCGVDIDGSTSYSDYFIIFKDQNNEWACAWNDGTSHIGWAYDSVRPSWQQLITRHADYSQRVSNYTWVMSSSGLTTGDRLQAYTQAASTDIASAPADTFALTYFPDGASGDYFAKIDYYGPYIRYTPV